jgi:hypothetical protein
MLAVAVCLSQTRAGTPKIEAVIAKDQDSKPTDSFSAETPKLYAFFRSTDTKAGDKIRGVWIADDVGEAAPKGTKIDEATITADKDNANGAFSMTKPTANWPVGQYHVDIYDGDQLATSVKFTITAGKAAKKSDKDKDDDDDDDDSD